MAWSPIDKLIAFLFRSFQGAAVDVSQEELREDLVEDACLELDEFAMKKGSPIRVCLDLDRIDDKFNVLPHQILSGYDVVDTIWIDISSDEAVASGLEKLKKAFFREVDKITPEISPVLNEEGLKL